jgi:hypothetical protein
VQVFDTHWLAVVQVCPFGLPQVCAVALHSPEAHTSVASVGLQKREWRPSPGIAMPAARSVVQTPVSRWQNWAAVQSLSFQQVPAAMHVVEFVEQMPDWQLVDAVACVQPEVPLVRPHLPFEPQTFVTHSGAFVAAGYVQLVVTFGPAHVFVVALHWPDTQVAAAFDALQVPSWSPSFGIATPMALSSTQVSALRSQCFDAAQSAST